MNNILVTGANGKIGQELAIKAANKGFNVKAAVRDKNKSDRINLKNIEKIDFHYENQETWEKALSDTDYIFLLSPSGITNPYNTILPFLNKVFEAKPKHIVFSTAMGIDRADRNPLKEIELEIMNSGIYYTFLRPNWFMQNFFTSLKSKIKDTGELILPAGDAKVSFIDTRDIAESAIISFTNPEMNNKRFTLTGGEAIDHFQVAEYLSEAVGKKIKYTPVLLVEYRKMLIQIGYPEETVNGIISIFEMMAKGFAEPVSDDLKKVFNIKPIRFEQFSKDYAIFWK